MGKGWEASDLTISYFNENKKRDYECPLTKVEGLNPVKENEVKSAMNDIKTCAIGNDNIYINMTKGCKSISHGGFFLFD